MASKEPMNESEKLIILQALDLHAKGRRIVPLHGPTQEGGCSCGKSDCRSPGKHPVQAAWYSRPFASKEAIIEWFTKNPVHNLGLVTGRGFLSIDVDLDRGGKESLARLEAELGPLPPTVRVNTGHGYHLWFKYPEAQIIPCGRDKPFPGIDIRGENGLAVAPGSRHFTGVLYEYEPGFGINEIEIAELPEHYLKRFMPSRGASDYGTDDTQEILYALELNDQGHARRVVEVCSEDLRFCPENGEWLVWNNKVWVIDTRNLSKSIVARLADPLIEMARREANKIIKDTLFSEANKLKDVAPAKAVLEAAKSQDEICICRESLNSKFHQLCVGNGILDLETGQLLPFARESFFTIQAPVNYDPSATCPRFDQFVDEIMCGKKDLVAFLLRFLGYCLCGGRPEEKVAFFYGKGANGKSTLIRVLHKMLGALASTAMAKTLIPKTDSINNDLAGLEHVRLVTSSEWDERHGIDEGNLKKLSGRDMLKARKLYHEYAEFYPQFQIVLLVNIKPSFDGQDEGLWRRIMLVPFEASFTGDKCDRNLDDKLYAELPGILNRLVMGYQDWAKQGLNPPEEVTAASNAYRAESDILGQFLNERCENDANSYLRSSELHSRFTEWCQANRLPLYDSRKFGNRMESKGYKKSNSGKNGHVRWHGLKLKPVIDANDLLLLGQGTDTPGLIENAANIDPLENIPVAKREMPFFIENINDRLV